MIEILELIDAIKFLKSTDTEINGKYAMTSLNKAASPRMASISKQAKANICQFPLLASSSLSVKGYTDTNKIIEQLYANYVKMAIMNNKDVIDLTKDQNVNSLISDIHQNDTANYGMVNSGTLVNRVGASVYENALPFSMKLESFRPQDLVKANTELTKLYSENFNLGILNGDENGHVLTESRDTYLDRIVTVRDQLFELKSKIVGIENRINDPNVNKTVKAGLQGQLDQLKKDEKDLQSVLEELTERQKLYNGEDDRTAKEIDSILKNAKTDAEIDVLRKKLADFNDKSALVGNVRADSSVIKKNNDLEPSLLTIDVTYSNGNAMKEKQIAIGVKCITHMIPSEELCFFIPDSLVKKQAIFRFIQWTTGEIKFMKDFVLDLDNVKFQATTDKSSIKWWKHLHTRSNASRVKGFFQHKGLIPNATIVMSKEDMEFIRIKDKIDLMGKDKAQVNKLMDYFFLLGFIVVDEVDDVIYMYDDLSKDWERYTFNQLARETKDALKKDNVISLR